MSMSEQLWAVIPAAGLGTRFGGKRPKQFAKIGGKTVLEWTTDRVSSMPFVAGIVIALPLEYKEHESVKQIKRKLTSRDQVDLVITTGGATRQETVRLSLKDIPSCVRWVMIHDAARPFITEALTTRVFLAAKKWSAAICGDYITDTVKSVVSFPDKQILFAQNTLSREGIIAVQTPQIFDLELLRQCHESAVRDGFVATDDSQLVEYLGHKVVIVKGERTNFKITFREEFEMASVLLNATNLCKSSNAKMPMPDSQTEIPTLRRNHPVKPRKLRRRNEIPVPVVGFGFDVHPLIVGRDCVLGGVHIPSSKGLLGHSDADVLCHAITDAILGAVNMGDIGQWYPSDRPEYKNINSLELLAKTWETLRKIAELVHLDCTLVAEEPRLAPYMERMKHNIAKALLSPTSKISIKAASPERLGSLGKGDGIAVFCAATLNRKGGV